jgi:5-methylcytosine-specific restriction endonuclease McrBC GTP-binding regulatory subunit McrB
MKNFVDLKNYLIKEIKPQENYQYFIFKELINSGRQISYDELAERYDAEYENTNKTDTKTILKDAPTSALSRHGYITSDKNNVYANFNEEPLYYKETISWILEKCLHHWVKNKSIKGLEFKEGVIKTNKEIEKFCYENNTPRDLVEKIILSINRGEKQIVLDGPPGTGKTYLIKKIIQFLSNSESISDLVQFHPSYGYEEFVEGLRPTSKNGSISFEVVPGKLISLIEKGKKYSFPIAIVTTNEMSNKKSIINKTEFKRNELTNAIDLENELTIEDFNKVFELQEVYSSENTEDMQLRDQYVKKDLPNKLEDFLNKGGYKDYKIQGSGGVGRKAAVPWVRIYREEFSKSAQEGYYLVYLFDAKGEKVYLSLNHASTNRETFTSITNEEAVKYVNDARELIKPLTDGIIHGQNKNENELNDIINYVWDIDLASNLNTPKAYEKTHIFGFEINKSHVDMSFNWDLINALELLEVIYNNLDNLENLTPEESTSVDISSLNKWTKIVYQALKNLNGKGHLSQIYDEVNELVPDKPKTWQAQVRASLERSSSDSEAFEGKNDLFALKEKGSGNWSIKNYTSEEGNTETTTSPEENLSYESIGNHNFLVIDEINRGNLPKIFGELLNAFEYRDENISLQYSDKPLTVPSNLIFLGTMNSTDKSVGRMDAAIRRRFDFIHVEPNYEVLHNFYQWNESHVPNLIQGLKLLNTELEKKLGKHCLIGHTFFMKSNDRPLMYEDLGKIWDRKIFPLLAEYFLDDPNELATFNSFENFWPIEKKADAVLSSGKIYSLDVLASDLGSISNELELQFNKIVDWSRNYPEINIYLGRRAVETFKTGGGTFIYQNNLQNAVGDERDKKYHIFRITGKGKFEIRLQDLYSEKFVRAPFNDPSFREDFELRLKDLFEANKIDIESDFFNKSLPGIPMESLVESQCIDQMLSFWDWVIENINKASSSNELI